MGGWGFSTLPASSTAEWIISRAPAPLTEALTPRPGVHPPSKRDAGCPPQCRAVPTFSLLWLRCGRVTARQREERALSAWLALQPDSGRASRLLGPGRGSRFTAALAPVVCDPSPDCHCTHDETLRPSHGLHTKSETSVWAGDRPRVRQRRLYRFQQSRDSCQCITAPTVRRELLVRASASSPFRRPRGPRPEKHF